LIENPFFIFHFFHFSFSHVFYHFLEFNFRPDWSEENDHGKFSQSDLKPNKVGCSLKIEKERLEKHFALPTCGCSGLPESLNNLQIQSTPDSGRKNLLHKLQILPSTRYYLVPFFVYMSYSFLLQKLPQLQQFQNHTLACL